MPRPRKTEQPELPPFAAAVRAHRGALTQEEYARRVGVSQTAVSDAEIGKEPGKRVAKRLIAAGIPRDLFGWSGGAPQNSEREGSTSVRRRLFLDFYSALSALHAEFEVKMKNDHFAWRAIELWTRALLLDHPETLVERMSFVLKQERQRLKREQDSAQ